MYCLKVRGPSIKFNKSYLYHTCMILSTWLVHYYKIYTEMCGNTGDVRLVGSVNNMTEGRLEICVNDYWGTVCNDGVNDVFDRHATEVVCKQLGFSESREYFE